MRASFIDDELRESHSDLVFSARLQDENVLLYVLLEHQRSVDRLMPYRMLRYVVRLWETWLRQHPNATKIPVVLPVVVHQGARPWSGPRRLEELFAVSPPLVETVRGLLPSFELTLRDLGREEVDELAALEAAPLVMRLALVVLRLAASGDPPADVFSRFAPLVAELLADERLRTRFDPLLRYIVVVGKLDSETLHQYLRPLSKEAREFVMSTGKNMIEEGVERGRVLGQRDLLARLLTGRFGELDEKTRGRLETATLADLELWAERILTAKTLASVFRKRRS